ncbi:MULTISPECIES: hypothetical protein [unclassified Novosphingobium]|uniref:hypothetical protein n=1 Tax=unclassified Novosphingobium TaxID=2644732 RepID=UPI00135C7BAA|nr:MULTISPECIES: hypothetical protein [unclassified Novosphingobium]
MTAANSHRGRLGFDLPFEGEAEPRRYVFAFSTNALCVLEEEFDLDNISELQDVLGERPSLRKIRKMFRIGLTDCHPDMSDVEAGQIIDAIGGLEPSLEMIMRAVTTAFPEAAESGAPGPRKPAPKAPSARGTGRNSTSAGARPKT